jgi:hypothetical protein
MTASQLAAKGQPAHGGKSWLSKVFELNPAGLNWPRAVMILDVALVPLVVFWAIGHEEYLLSAIFGAEGYRMLWALCGVAIGVLVMFLALLARRAPTAKQPAPAGQAA